TKKPFEMEHRILRADGSVGWIHSRAVPRLNAARKIVEWLGTARDITGYKREDEQLRHLGAIVNSSVDAIYSLRLDGRISSWNPGAEKLYGYAGGEIIGQPVARLVPRDRLAEEQRIWKRVRAGEIIRSHETVRRRKNGSHVEVSTTSSPILDSSKRIVGTCVLAHDISQRREAEHQARLQTNKLENMLEVIPTAVWITNDKQCHEVYGNAFAARLLRLPQFANLSPTPPSGTPADVRYYRNGCRLKPPELPLQQAIDTGKEQPLQELEIELPQGERLTLFGASVPLFNENGKVAGAIAAFNNITPHKKLERELRHTTEQLELAHEIAKVGTFEWNILTGETSRSKSMDELYGLPNNASIRNYEDWVRVLHPQDSQRVQSAVARILKEGKFLDMEYRIVKPGD
ncbi:MAG TPA: PAS domain S-box protein, partial [Candidatus Binatia bacterium]|nr:PAS domain S-box protein [Candidatus Binatia bacterium]